MSLSNKATTIPQLKSLTETAKVCSKDSPSSSQLVNASNHSDIRTGRSTTAVTNMANISGISSFSKSPLRSSNNHHYTTQRLRNPSFSSSQRRPSLTGGDPVDYSFTSGMPYSYTFGGGSIGSNTSNTGSMRSSVFPSGSTRTNSPRASPRGSVTSSLDHTFSTNKARSRRHSEHILRNHSTADVFDQMEREQDAIVMKLMKEISQLKEDNRALVHTINQLTSSSYMRSRNNSIVSSDDVEMNKGHCSNTSQH